MSVALERSPIEVLLSTDPDVYATLLDWALFKVGNKTAQDVTQTTIVRAVRQSRIGTGWKGGDRDAGLLYLRGILQGVLKDSRRSHRRRPPAQGDAPEVRDDGPLPEEQLAEKMELRARRDKLREALEDDSQGVLPLGMLDAAAKGIEGNKAMVDAIGCTMPELLNARKRLERRARQLLTELT